jgi:ribosomal-protein-alanine N-acetyltransferase
VTRWPATVRAVQPGGATIVLRPLSRRDKAAWTRLRVRNEGWLRPWEATVPARLPEPNLSFGQLRRGLERGAREGRLLPFVVEADGELVGQMHLFDIVWGPRCTGTAGYWLDRAATGRGLATWSLAMLVDFALHDYGLHRVEVNIRPENVDSLAVVRRLGLRDEGERPGLVHVDGAWRDHRSFAITAEEVADRSLVRELTRTWRTAAP